MTHEPLNPHDLLKKLSTSIAIICTLLILVGCATNKSNGATYEPAGASAPPTNFLEGISNNINTAARRLTNSRATHATADEDVITQSSNPTSGSNGSTIDTLIAKVTALNGITPTYKIDYTFPDPNQPTRTIREFDIMTTDPSVREVEHTTPPMRNGMNLKRTVLEYEVDAGGAGTDTSYYLEIYTNYGESHRHNAGETYDENNYLAIGTWLSLPTDRTITAPSFYSVGAFVNAADSIPSADVPALTGNATYMGAAYGFILVYEPSTSSSIAEAEIVPVEADVEFTANFAAGTETLSGMIGNFAIKEGISSSTITDITGSLQMDARFDMYNIATQAINPSSLTFGGRTHTFSGGWSYQFNGRDGTNPPDGIAGTVVAAEENINVNPTENAALYLGYGAYRQ